MCVYRAPIWSRGGGQGEGWGVVRGVAFRDLQHKMSRIMEEEEEGIAWASPARGGERGRAGGRRGERERGGDTDKGSDH